MTTCKWQVSILHQTLEDRVRIIRESFQAGSADLLEVSGSFRVDFESGQSVYIYAETYDNAITARFETKEADPGKRRHETAALRQLLLKELCFADVSEFQEVQSGKGRFVYTADIRIDESVVFHQTIVYGAGASVEAEESFSEKETDAIDTHEASAGVPSDLTRAEKAIEMLETIDAKMLRQSMDMMNLKRSSNVRMVLTRIFRDAVDAGALMLSIQDEAVKLNSENDYNELRVIKAINTNGFLEPVIGLLYDAVFNKDET